MQTRIIFYVCHMWKCVSPSPSNSRLSLWCVSAVKCARKFGISFVGQLFSCAADYSATQTYPRPYSFLTLSLSLIHHFTPAYFWKSLPPRPPMDDRSQSRLYNFDTISRLPPIQQRHACHNIRAQECAHINTHQQFVRANCLDVFVYNSPPVVFPE